MKQGKESEDMFDDRMGEELEWVQLDLDEISHDVSGNGLIVPICHQIGNWGIDKLLDKYLDVHQKVYDFTPNQKIMELMASMMFGCEDNKRINKVLREDNPEYSIFFGLPRWAEQSVVSDTFRALTGGNISQLEMVWQESLRETQVIENLRRRIEAGEYITIDIDLTGDVCKSKDDPTVTKGYFAQKKGKTGRQKAWAYMTDAYGGIQHLLALEYGSGKMRVQHCLGSLLEKIMTLFSIKGNKHRHLRKRIVDRCWGWNSQKHRVPGGIWLQLLSERILIPCSRTGMQCSARMAEDPWQRWWILWDKFQDRFAKSEEVL